MKKFNRKARTACVALALILSYLVVYYTVDNTDIFIPTLGTVNDNFVIVLDAGHHAYVLSAVA